MKTNGMIVNSNKATFTIDADADTDAATTMTTHSWNLKSSGSILMKEKNQATLSAKEDE